MPSIECPACHLRYVWKADLGGRMVRCDCGKTFPFPSQPADEADIAAAGSEAAVLGTPRGVDGGGLSDADFFPEEETALRPAAPAIHCPSCNLMMKGGAVVCLNCGYSIETGRRIKTQVNEPSAPPSLPGPPPAFAKGEIDPDLAPPPVSMLPPLAPLTPRMPGEDEAQPVGRSRTARALLDREDAADDTRFTDLHLPLIFIIGGAGVTMLAHVAAADTLARGLISGAVSVALQAVIMVPMLLATLYLTAHAMSISYGPLTVGMLKITGIALGPLALADWLLAVILSATLGFGIWIAIALYAVIAGIPVSLMFDLDTQEMLITVCAIILMRILFNFVLLGVVLSALL